MRALVAIALLSVGCKEKTAEPGKQPTSRVVDPIPTENLPSTVPTDTIKAIDQAITRIDARIEALHDPDCAKAANAAEAISQDASTLASENNRLVQALVTANDPGANDWVLRYAAPIINGRITALGTKVASSPCLTSSEAYKTAARAITAAVTKSAGSAQQ